ncbi:MAG: helix-hairpin-helix domain-containing protein [Bacteroidota bacterium]
MEIDFANLFDGFDTQDSYAILFITLIGFLFGLLVGYLLRTRRVILLKRELKAVKKKLSEAEAEINVLKEQIDLKDADLKKASLDKEEMDHRISRLEGDKNKYYNQVLVLKNDLERLQTSSRTYTDTIEDLQNQIVQLQTQAVAVTDIPASVVLEEELDVQEEEQASTVDFAAMQDLYATTRSRLEALEVKLDRLEGENEELKGALVTIKSQQERLREQQTVPAENSTTTPTHTADTTPEIDEEEPIVIPSMSVSNSSNRIVQPIEKAAIKERIVTDEVEKDDLTRIEGLGPFLQKKLYEIGVYTYEDIAQLNAQGIAQVTKAIGYLPGRIEKDDWVGQAQKLAQLKAENPAAFASPSPGQLPSSDDLKIIEGIGPKIEQILKEGGIADWNALTEAKAKHLRKILDAAGSRFRVHDPGTWPAQARLAVNGEWDLLREYQDELKGGRLVD